MAHRCLLHRNDLGLFRTWLRENKYLLQPLKGEYEALRARHPEKGLVLIFDRDRGDHFTVRHEDIGVVRRFYNSKFVRDGGGTPGQWEEAGKLMRQNSRFD